MPFFTINQATSGDTLLVSAPPGLGTIIVQGFWLKGAAAVNFKFGSKQNGAMLPLMFNGGSTVTYQGGPAQVGNAGDGVSTGYYPPGVFACLPGQALVLNIDGAVQVSGQGHHKTG